MKETSDTVKRGDNKEFLENTMHLLELFLFLIAEGESRVHTLLEDSYMLFDNDSFAFILY